VSYMCIYLVFFIVCFHQTRRFYCTFNELQSCAFCSGHTSWNDCTIIRSK